MKYIGTIGTTRGNGKRDGRAGCWVSLLAARSSLLAAWVRCCSGVCAVCVVLLQYNKTKLRYSRLGSLLPQHHILCIYTVSLPHLHLLFFHRASIHHHLYFSSFLSSSILLYSACVHRGAGVRGRLSEGFHASVPPVSLPLLLCLLS